jgi:dolichol-phosphate mannosyltransferase
VNLSIIVPFHNEVGNVPKVRDELIPVARALGAAGTVELICVDDGSTDGSLDAFRAALLPQGVPVRFERHPHNLGLGAALKTGFAAARGDVLLTTDCDGTYAFQEIPALLAHLTPEVDLVTASPYHPEGSVDGVSAFRLLLSRGSSLIYRLLVDPHIYTYTALFRAYRRRVIDEVSFESNGFLAGTELLVNARLQGFHIAEYPTVLHSRVSGVSKARIARTISAHLRFQGQVFIRRLRRRRPPEIQQGKTRTGWVH